MAESFRYGTADPASGQARDVIPPDGVLSIACAPDGWTITIQQRAGDGWLPAGTGHVVVPPGGSATLRVTLEKAANLNP